MDIDFPVIEAIIKRRSVRTYMPEQIDAALRDMILKFATKLDNPFGVEGINIQLVQRQTDGKPQKLGTYGVIKGAGTYTVLSTPPDRLSMLMAGYEFETLVLYITSLGLGTVWLGGTFSRNDFAKTVTVGDGCVIPAVSPVGYPDRKRFTEKIMRMAVKSDSRKPWRELFFNRDFDTVLTEAEAGSYAKPLEMVRLAPSATNKQPWRILRDGATYHFYGDFHGKDSDTETRMRYLDMGIAMCHFSLSCQSLGLKGHFYFDARGDRDNRYNYIVSWQCE